MNEIRDVRNVWCVALNYHETAKQVNATPTPEPIFFLKAGSTIISEKQPILLPSFSQEVIYELELALQFNEKLEVEWAGLALDLTARDLQRELKARGFPWTLAKSFKHSCPIGSFFPIQSIKALENLEFSLDINGSVRLRGNTGDMIFSCTQLVAYALAHFPISPYDLLLTGTPAGISEVKKGDRILGKIGDHYTAQWTVHR